jgi:hypothetical protein
VAGDIGFFISGRIPFRETQKQKAIKQKKSMNTVCGRKLPASSHRDAEGRTMACLMIDRNHQQNSVIRTGLGLVPHFIEAALRQVGGWQVDRGLVR